VLDLELWQAWEMDFSLSARQAMFQQKVQAFASGQLESTASQLDRSGSCPAEIIDAIASLGLMGAFVPEEHGGAGEDYVSYIAALEEISKAWASLGAIVSIQNTLVCYPILRFGDEAQKRRYLPLLTRERQLGCYAFAEPSAGSDAGAIQTTATPSGDTFILNGEKLFVTNGRPAHIVIVYALTDPSRGRDGLSAFIVEKNMQGVSVGATQEKLGLHAAETVGLSFADCRVPKANLLGGLNRGFEVARAVVERARIDIAAQAVGIAQACLDKSIAQAKTRQQFGRAIAEFEAIQWMLADMSTEIEAARLLTHRVASQALGEDDGALTLQSSMAKLYASEAANRAAYNAVQVFGGHGYLNQFPVERYFRDARAMTLYEETSEIARLVIERELARDL
jgi:alkylation response protein AidB-like acyl-CoA dehydrogenase